MSLRRRISADTFPGRPCGPYPRHVPSAALKAELERQLQLAPRMLHVLARLLGYSESSVRVRLLELEEERRVHRVPVRRTAAGGRRWEWHAGAMQEGFADDEVGPGEIPRQAVVHQYPSVGRRENLVAALFGPGCGGAS